MPFLIPRAGSSIRSVLSLVGPETIRMLDTAGQSLWILGAGVERYRLSAQGQRGAAACSLYALRVGLNSGAPVGDARFAADKDVGLVALTVQD